MILNLSDQSSETLQEQLVRQVRAQVLTGDLSAGTELPSIRGLARAEKVSVVTVQRAYEALERTGLVRARRGVGYFVAELSETERTALAVANLDAGLVPLVQQARAEGLTDDAIVMRVRQLFSELVP